MTVTMWRILQNLFFDWTAERLIRAVGLLAFLSFVLFAWVNIGTGVTQEIYGTVRNVGMDTGTVFTLPRVVATVETEDGKVVSVEIPVAANVTKESKLILGKRQRLLTDGHEYEFLRLVSSIPSYEKKNFQ
jgi:hypothetical protein